MIVMVVFLFIGCAGPRFKSEAQYDKGEWKGDAYLNEVAEIKRDKAQLAFDKEVGAMAISKLKEQPIETKIINGVNQGYKGVVHNDSNYETVQIVIKHKKGYEVKSYVLSPGDWKENYLLPGTYKVFYIINGKLDRVGEITSGPRMFEYFGKDYHWYAYQPK